MDGLARMGISERRRHHNSIAHFASRNLRQTLPLVLIAGALALCGCPAPTEQQGMDDEDETKGVVVESVVTLTSEELDRLLLESAKGNTLPLDEASPVYKVCGKIESVSVTEETVTATERRGKVIIRLVLESHPNVSVSAKFGIHRADELRNRAKGEEICFRGRLHYIGGSWVTFSSCLPL